jgi:hypothetical protein
MEIKYRWAINFLDDRANYRFKKEYSKLILHP